MPLRPASLVRRPLPGSNPRIRLSKSETGTPPGSTHPPCHRAPRSGSRALFNELFRPLSLRKPVVSGFQFRRGRLCYKFLMKITEQWLLFTYVNGEFTPLSKPFKSKAAAEKARLKLPEREQRKVSMGVIRIMK